MLSDHRSHQSVYNGGYDIDCVYMSLDGVFYDITGLFNQQLLTQNFTHLYFVLYPEEMYLNDFWPDT